MAAHGFRPDAQQLLRAGPPSWSRPYPPCAMSGTSVACLAKPCPALTYRIPLRQIRSSRIVSPYPISGTHVVCRATPYPVLMQRIVRRHVQYSRIVSPYANSGTHVAYSPTPCPLLTQRMVLPGASRPCSASST
eukprot:1235873-Rhodomonas_salina.1